MKNPRAVFLEATSLRDHVTISDIRIHKVAHTAGTSQPAKSRVLKEQAPCSCAPQWTSYELALGGKGVASGWEPMWQMGNSVVTRARRTDRMEPSHKTQHTHSSGFMQPQPCL